MIRVLIPVEPHVQKFLIQRYGLWHVASKTKVIGLEVINSLKKEYEKPDKSIDGHKTYTVYIPLYYTNTKGHTVSKNNLQHLGIVMGIMFDEDMCQYLDLKVKEGKKALPELKAWLEHQKITEDDVKVESLYKNYQRHCKMRIREKKIAVHS